MQVFKKILICSVFILSFAQIKATATQMTEGNNIIENNDDDDAKNFDEEQIQGVTVKSSKNIFVYKREDFLSNKCDGICDDIFNENYVDISHNNCNCQKSKIVFECKSCLDYPHKQNLLDCKSNLKKQNNNYSVLSEDQIREILHIKENMFNKSNSVKNEKLAININGKKLPDCKYQYNFKCKSNSILHYVKSYNENSYNFKLQCFIDGPLMNIIDDDIKFQCKECRSNFKYKRDKSSTPKCYRKEKEMEKEIEKEIMLKIYKKLDFGRDLFSTDTYAIKIPKLIKIRDYVKILNQQGEEETYENLYDDFNNILIYKNREKAPFNNLKLNLNDGYEIINNNSKDYLILDLNLNYLPYGTYDFEFFVENKFFGDVKQNVSLISSNAIQNMDSNDNTTKMAIFDIFKDVKIDKNLISKQCSEFNKPNEENSEEKEIYDDLNYDNLYVKSYKNEYDDNSKILENLCNYNFDFED